MALEENQVFYLTEDSFRTYGYEPTYEEYFLEFVDKSWLDGHKSSSNNQKVNVTSDKEHTEWQSIRKVDFGPKIKYSRFSKIKKADRKFYLDRISQRSSTLLGSLPEHDEKKFQEIWAKVKEEQADCSRFLHDFARANPNWYLHLSAKARSTVISSLKGDIASALHAHPGLYSLHQTISLKHGFPAREEMIISFVKTVTQRGQCDRLKHLPTKELDLSSFDFNVRDRRDVNGDVAENIDSNVSIFISWLSILTIVRTFSPHFSNEWAVPFNVAEIAEGSGVARKFVQFQLPLPPRNMSTREANLYYYGNLVSSAMIDRKATPIRLDVKRSSAETEALVSSGSVPMLGLVGQDESKKLVQDLGNNSRTSSSEKSESRLSDHDRGQSSTSAIGFLGENSVLNLFRVGAVYALVESSVSGHQPLQEGKTQFLQLFPKIELQCQAGLEQFSVFDIATIWWTSVLSNVSTVLCCRVDPRRDAVVCIDEYERDAFCGPGSPYMPNQSAKFLQNVFDATLKLAIGDYLMEHSAGSTHVCIYRSSGNGGSFKLSDLYKAGLASDKDFIADKDIHWLPIDTQILLPHADDALHVPCTYPVHQKKAKKRSRQKAFS